MSSIDNKINNDLYWKKETGTTPENNNGQLTQADFFSLLTEQLSNQDPTKPVDNDQMIAQMTNFTMADSLSQLNNKFDEFATSMTSNQALQASSLVGRNVLVAGNDAVIKGDGGLVTGNVISDRNVKDMRINITNEVGETVRIIDAGSQQAGSVEFSWDGTDSNGNPLPPGNYEVSAFGAINGEEQQLPTAMYRHVNSVNLSSSQQGVILNLDGEDSITLADVLEIGS
jgi:flagellar basal-body rod modification protein FlgD